MALPTPEMNALAAARLIIKRAKLQLQQGWADRGSILDRAREVLDHAEEHLRQQRRKLYEEATRNARIEAASLCEFPEIELMPRKQLLEAFRMGWANWDGLTSDGRAALLPRLRAMEERLGRLTGGPR